MILRYDISEAWRERIRLAVQSADNAFIPRVNGAGELSRGKQMMHNGLRVNVGSYYGPEIVQLLRANRGVHEPQEERVFQEVLRRMAPGSTMIELGSFWSFYSMWFQLVVPNARNYMIEPDAHNLESGKRNFRLNRMVGHFTHARIGDRSEVVQQGVVKVCIDDFVKTEGIARVHILHSDIQGHEHEMLVGATSLLRQGRVDYIFISTHSDSLHSACLATLRGFGYEAASDVRPERSDSVDGLIVAHKNDLVSPTVETSEI